MAATRSSSGASRAVNGSVGISGSWPSPAASIPSHITGATSGATRRFAGSDASETVPKMWAISGPVASVAESVSAMRIGERAREPGAEAAGPTFAVASAGGA